MALVTFICPNMVVGPPVQGRSTCSPIGLAYLASSLRHDGHEV